MRLKDLAGSLSVDSDQAACFIKAWFDPNDIIVVSSKRMIPVQGESKVMSQCLTAMDFVTSINDEQLESLCTDPVPMDLYVNVGSPRDCVGTYARVKEVDLDHIIGVAADLDVKDTGFKSTQEIYDFLKTLGVQPTIVVESGSGGVHAWWKFSERLRKDAGKDLYARWWTYLNQKAFAYNGAHIDKLVDLARMFRIPGSLHWPRNGQGAVGAVRLVSSDGPVADVARMLALSVDSWEARNKAVKETRTRDLQMVASADDYIAKLSKGKWGAMWAAAHVDEWFNEHMPWENILRPAGWTFTRTDSVGRDEWARPGREGEKSAAVNWDESPHVMSLLSTAHETGMLDLLDAGIPLTKWRVSLRLNFEDNYQALVDWTLGCMVEWSGKNSNEEK